MFYSHISKAVTAYFAHGCNNTFTWSAVAHVLIFILLKNVHYEHHETRPLLLHCLCSRKMFFVTLVTGDIGPSNPLFLRRYVILITQISVASLSFLPTSLH